MAKSILQKKDGTCYLCRLLYGDDSRKRNLEEHHVFYGKGNRKKSEQYGLKVYLCYWHHNQHNGEHAVHFNPRMRQILEEKGREAFLQSHTEEEFRAEFGGTYLTVRREKEGGGKGQTEGKDSAAAAGRDRGFCWIEDGIDAIDWE